MWETVEKGNKELENEDTLSQVQKNGLRDLIKRAKNALYLIYQGLDEDAFEKISQMKATKEAWEKLQTSSKEAYPIKKVHLQTFKSRI